MTEQPDREFLLSIFLMEAWDTVSILEDGAPGLSAGGDIEPLLLVAHRLRGAAALHGFPRLAEQAAAIEAMLEGAASAEDSERAAIGAALGDAVIRLREGLEGVGGSQLEPAPPAEEPAPAAASRGGLVEELAGFFAANADVLEYFGPGGGRAPRHHHPLAPGHRERGRPGRRGGNALSRLSHPQGRRVHRRLPGHRRLRASGRGPSRRHSRRAPAVRARRRGGDARERRRHPAHARPLPRVRAGSRTRWNARRACSPTLTRPEAVEIEEVPAVHAAVEPVVAAAPGAAREAVPVRPAAGASRISIRVAVDRLDSLMNLVGELVVARSRMDEHLGQLDRVAELLLWSRSRMAQAVRTFEGKYEYTALPALSGARAGSGSGAPPAAPPASLGGGFAHDFEELEFDRYDDFNILSRRVAEVSADVGEVHNQLAALVRAVREDAAQVQRLTWGLRGEITRSRLVRIGTLFARSARQVRAVARETGKSVDLQLAGEGVELDNTIIEQIADPLLHLVQNAVFHGIEPEAERRAAGKPAHGTMHLRAYQEGGAVFVEVEDDGRGIDTDRLRASAVRSGFLDEESAAKLGEREALDLVFLPGFSTAEVATSVAGRGVGMDVVRTNVLRLGGEIDVETEVGVGTRFTLKLPLTVLIGDALGIRVGDTELAVPVTSVRGLHAVRPDEIHSGSRRRDGRDRGRDPRSSPARSRPRPGGRRPGTSRPRAGAPGGPARVRRHRGRVPRQAGDRHQEPRRLPRGGRPVGRRQHRR